MIIVGSAFAVQTDVETASDTFGVSWTRQHAMNTELYTFMNSSTTWQAYDSDLATYAGITPSANVQSFLGAADYAAAKALLGLTDANILSITATYLTLTELTSRLGAEYDTEAEFTAQSVFQYLPAPLHRI